MTVDRKADVSWQDNFAPAFYNLANCYRKGFGIDTNKERAEAWAAYEEDEDYEE